ncbi:MAG: SHOCT domain-containing protein [Ornithinibacter sp.]
MYWGNGVWGAGDWVAMSAMMVLFWGVLAAAVVWFVRMGRGNRGPVRSADHADVLLAERFARGEIDGDEFTRGRELLHGSGSSRLRGGS